MDLSIKSLLILIIIAILHSHAFSQGDTSAISLYDSGESMVKKNPDNAFQLFERAMKLSRQNKEWEIYIRSINGLAHLSFTRIKNKQEQVFNWLKEGVAILKDAKENNDLAQLHFYTAEFYNALTIEIDQPIFHYNLAKKIWTNLKGELSEEVSSCYHGLGNIYKYYKFDFHEAEKCYEKALFIRNKINFQDITVLYKNHYSLAATNGSQQDFEKALSYGSKALELAKKLEPIRIEMSYGMMANIYRDMGESTMAKKFYLNALTLNEQTKNVETRAWYYLCLGETLKNDSLLNDALDYFQKAYALYSLPEVKDQGLFISLLIDLIETYSVMGFKENFSKNSKKVVLIKDDKHFASVIKEVFHELNSLDMLRSREAAQIWLLVGNHYGFKKNYDSALFHYQKALIASVPSFASKNVFDNPTEDQIGFRYYVNEILAKKASSLKSIFEISKETEYLNQSLTCLKLSEKLLSEQRNTLDMEDSKWEFMEASYDLYENILTNLYEGKKSLVSDSVNQLAFQYFERSKSRSLADALTQTERTRQITNQDSLFRLHADLKRQLFSAQDAINRESENIKGSGNLAKLRDEIVRLDQRIQLIKLAIEEKYPGYFNVKYGYQAAPLRRIQKMLQEKDQVLFEYFWGSKSVYALGITNNDIIFQRIGSPDSIGAIINRLLLHLNDEHSSMNPSLFKLFTNNAHELYKILVEPFSQLLLNKKRIQIIPDGSISQIPFEILLEKEPTGTGVNYRHLNYMIRSFTIGYVYTSSVLINKKPLRRAVSPSLLAIGFTGGQRLREANQDLEDIEGAEKELNALEKRFNAGKFLIGKDATESNFKAFAPNYDIIHLAIHGKGDIRKNFAASLYFRSKFDKQDDGELHAYELYGLKLKALMAVLSSCESGLGKGYKGEGMISMASAFTYSGCENILMSLWKVNDQASTLLMDNFYGHLLDGETIDEALRQAKLNYLENADELTADPKIWAPLVVYGSLDPIFQKDRSRIFILFALLAVVAIVLLSFKALKRKIVP